MCSSDLPDDPSQMILAVEADGAGYRDSGSVRDRDRLRKEHLERLGWRVHRLWSTSWFSDPEAELAKLQAAYVEAVRANPPAPPVPAPPPPAPVPDDPALADEPVLADDAAAAPDELAPPPDPVPDRTSVTPRIPEAPPTRAPASPTREVPPGRHGSPALDPRRAPIALPAGDPASARGLPAANG